MNGPSPTKTKSFRLQKVDNERQRYLTIDEEQRLLDTVKRRGETAYRMAILSIGAGMRFKEIARLTYGSLAGLQIVLSRIPPPAPPPSKDALDLVWAAGEPAAGTNGNTDGGSNPGH